MCRWGWQPRAATSARRRQDGVRGRGGNVHHRHAAAHQDVLQSGDVRQPGRRAGGDAGRVIHRKCGILAVRGSSGKREPGDGLRITGYGGATLPVADQIRGSTWRDRIRLISCADLLSLLKLKVDLDLLELKDVDQKVQSILLPLDTIDVGHLVRVIIEIAALRRFLPARKRMKRQRQ